MISVVMLRRPKVLAMAIELPADDERACRWCQEGGQGGLIGPRGGVLAPAVHLLVRRDHLAPRQPSQRVEPCRPSV